MPKTGFSVWANINGEDVKIDSFSLTENYQSTFSTLEIVSTHPATIAACIRAPQLAPCTFFIADEGNVFSRQYSGLLTNISTSDAPNESSVTARISPACSRIEYLIGNVRSKNYTLYGILQDILAAIAVEPQMSAVSMRAALMSIQNWYPLVVPRFLNMTYLNMISSVVAGSGYKFFINMTNDIVIYQGGTFHSNNQFKLDYDDFDRATFTLNKKLEGVISDVID